MNIQSLQIPVNLQISKICLYHNKDSNVIGNNDPGLLIIDHWDPYPPTSRDVGFVLSVVDIWVNTFCWTASTNH